MSDPAQKKPLAEDVEANKTLRMLEAILASGYDGPTRMVLTVLAKDLNSQRHDWAVWRAIEGISQRSGFGRSTVLVILARVEKDEVLRRWKKPHYLQVMNKAGRYSTCYSMNLERLQRLGKEFDVKVRPSRGRRQAEWRRVQGLKTKARNRRWKAEEDKEHRAKLKAEGEMPDDNQAYQNTRTGRITETDASNQEQVIRTDQEARQAEADLNGEAASDACRLTICKEIVAEAQPELTAANATREDRDEDGNDGEWKVSLAKSRLDDAAQELKTHIKDMNERARKRKSDESA
jgi:hypothetical protein